jgi:hypothetical protein
MKVLDRLHCRSESSQIIEDGDKSQEGDLESTDLLGELRKCQRGIGEWQRGTFICFYSLAEGGEVEE